MICCGLLKVKLNWRMFYLLERWYSISLHNNRKSEKIRLLFLIPNFIWLNSLYIMWSLLKYNLIALSLYFLSCQLLLWLYPRPKIMLLFVSDLIIKILIQWIIKRDKCLFVMRVGMFFYFECFIKFDFIFRFMRLCFIFWCVILWYLLCLLFRH
jgi:hypothetical protein